MKRSCHSFLILLFSILSLCSQAQWHPANGPEGGFLNLIKRNGSLLYAGTSGGGVFVSSDSGNTWVSRNTGITTFVVENFTFIGTEAFAGTRDNGVFHTSDSGLSWHSVNNGLPLQDFSVITLATNGTTLFAGTNGDGIFKSSDSGNTWIQVDSGLTNLYVKGLFVKDSTIFADVLYNTYRSTNNGISWTKLSINYNSSIYTIGEFAVKGTTIFGDTKGASIFKSTDNGTTWTPSNTGLPPTNAVYSIVLSGSTMYASISNGKVYKSTNDGVSWVVTNIDMGTNLPNQKLEAGFGSVFISTFGFGAFRSDDAGNSFKSINRGLIATDVLSLAFDDSTVYAGTDKSGIFRLNDNGVNWDTTANLSTYNAQGIATNGLAIAVNGNNVFAGTNKGVFLSTNKGVTWTAKVNGLTNKYVNSLVFLNGSLYAGTDAGVFRTDNNGTSWYFLGLYNTPVFTFAVGGNNVYAGTESQGVYKFDNTLGAWSQISNGISFYSIASIATNGSSIFAGVRNVGVFQSSDNGITWNKVINGLSNLYIRSLAVIGEYVFAGTTDGVFLSKNNGVSWTPVNDGLFNYNIASLAISDTVIYAGTSRSGVVMRSICDFLSKPTMTESDSTIFCKGDSIHLTSSNANSYLWSNGDTTQSITVSTTGTYSVKIVDNIGCTAYSEPLSIVVNDPPVVTISSSAISVCAGDSVKLTALGADSFIWSGNIKNGVSFLPPSGSSTYYLLGVDSISGCRDTLSATISVTTINTAVTDSLGYLLTNSQNATFLWLDCDSGYAAISNQVNGIYRPLSSGSYAVVITQNGCIDTSSCYPITLTGIEELLITEKLNISPNPFTNQTTIQAETNFINGEVRLYTMQGKLVIQLKCITGNAITLGRDELPAGIYFLSIKDENRKASVHKLVIAD